MIPRTLRTLRTVGLRRYSVPVPFGEDLTEVDDDLFGLEDFKHYKESPLVAATRQLLNVETATKAKLDDMVLLPEPMVFVSKLTDPYTNLALEDYIYNKMPSADKCQRLLFYVNSPCVVIGKNQNPWKEANVPLVTSLHIPLLRRKSGGGTVVHDSGNVNFSFMTSKKNFSRFSFVRLVCDAVNATRGNIIEVNQRGDITTVKQPDGINYKVSGSAYKLSRGKSYHHGTMLLDLKLDILRQLLQVSPENNGVVESTVSVESVRAKVANIHMDSADFINCVTQKFKDNYGLEVELDASQKEHNELFGIEDFVDANLRVAQTFVVDSDTVLNEEISKVAQELRLWEWRFGNTPKFTHEFSNPKYGVKIKFHVGKGAIVEDFELTVDSSDKKQAIEQLFVFLRQTVDRGELQYIGSEISGLITHDGLSDWIGECIDGTT